MCIEHKLVADPETLLETEDSRDDRVEPMETDPPEPAPNPDPKEPIQTVA